MLHGAPDDGAALAEEGGEEIIEVDGGVDCYGVEGDSGDGVLGECALFEDPKLDGACVWDGIV